MYFLIKIFTSAAIIALVSEVAKRSPSLGGLIASLPLVSLMGILWLWHDTEDKTRIADHAFSTFWYVLPSLPMFLLLPYLLRRDVPFAYSMAACVAMTFALYLATVWGLARFGIKI